MPVYTAGVRNRASEVIRHPSLLYDLQQPTTFRPFVRQFIKLALVTGRAGGDNVGDIVTPSSRKRYDVISMPYKTLFDMLLLAVITPMTLAFHLLLKLIRGEGFGTTKYSSATPVINRLSDGFSMPTPLIFLSPFPAMLGIINSRVTLSAFFNIFVIIPFSMRFLLFSMILVVLSMIRAPFLFVFFFPLSTILAALFLMLLIIQFVSLTSTCFAVISSSIVRLVKTGKRKDTSTHTALFALRGVKGYTIVHGRSSFLSSRLRMFAASLSHHIYIPILPYNSLQCKFTPLFCPTATFLEAK